MRISYNPQYKPTRSIMQRLDTPLLTIAIVVGFIGISAHAQEWAKRPTCESEGRCNLSTGEVYTPEQLNARKLLDLFGE